MDAKSIIDALDVEIEALRQARALLVNSGATAGTKTGGAKARKAVKRVLSPEARKRIADAQRKRWAAVRKPKKAGAAAPASAARKAASKKKSSGGAKKAATKKATAAKAKKAAPRKSTPAKSEPASTGTVAS